MLACMLVHVIVSLLTPAPSDEVVNTLTWNAGLYRAETKELAGLPWYKNYRVLAVILLIITAVVVGSFW